jgi:hypothetical protein
MGVRKTPVGERPPPSAIQQPFGHGIAVLSERGRALIARLPPSAGRIVTALTGLIVAVGRTPDE